MPAPRKTEETVKNLTNEDSETILGKELVSTNDIVTKSGSLFKQVEEDSKSAKSFTGENVNDWNRYVTYSDGIGIHIRLDKANKIAYFKIQGYDIDVSLSHYFYIEVTGGQVFELTKISGDNRIYYQNENLDFTEKDNLWSENGVVVNSELDGKNKQEYSLKMDALDRNTVFHFRIFNAETENTVHINLGDRNIINNPELPFEVYFAPIDSEDYDVLSMQNAPAEAGADVTANHTAASIFGQGNLATRDYTTYIQDSEPTAGEEGDFWVDSNDKNRLYRYDGNNWVDVRDGGIKEALDEAILAQDIADGEIVGFFQDNEPSGVGEKFGDIWIDTDADPFTEDNAIYRYQDSNGSFSGTLAWRSAPNNSVGRVYFDASNAQATADGKITTFYSSTAPTAEGVGDLWVDTDDDNKLYRWDSTEWVLVRDEGIPRALQDVADAQEALDGEIVGFYQDTAPSGQGEKFGDIWIDIDASPFDQSNAVYRYQDSNGSYEGTLSWYQTPDHAVGKVYFDAYGAQATADGKITTFYQSTAPASSDSKQGDLWVDTSDDNKMYRYDETSSSWVLIRDEGIADALSQAQFTKAAQDGEVKGYFQDTTPSGEGEKFGDIWIDTSSSPPGASDIYRYEDSDGLDQGTMDWRSKPTNAIGLFYLDQFNENPDGTITTFIQSTEPTANGVGDFWYNTDTEVVKRWDGQKWTTNIPDLTRNTMNKGVEIVQANGGMRAGKGGPNDDSNAGFFIGRASGGTPEFRIGDNIYDLHWDGSTLTVTGNITVQNPANVRSDINVEDGATFGADWVDNLVSKPDGADKLKTSPSTGLNITGSYMGYYDGSVFQSYIDSNGNFAFNGDADNYISWDGTTLDVTGTINIQSGGGVLNLTDAGDLAGQSDADWSTQVTGTGKPSDNADVTANQFSNTLANIDDGTDRSLSGMDSNGNLTSKVIPGTAAAPGGSGLFIGSDYMGYYDGGNWSVYIDSNGAFGINDTATSSALVITDQVIKVFDSNGTLRVQMGDLSA